MQFIDTHIHLQDYKTKNTTDILREAAECGVKKVICASIVETDWEVIAGYCREFPDIIIPAFGLHPWFVRDTKPGWEKRLGKMLNLFPQALVGEAGLDRLRDEDFEPQNSIFRTQIEISHLYRRPLLIHAVRAQDWLEPIWMQLPYKFVFHSYNGRREMLQKILSHGGYVSFSSSLFKIRDPKEIVTAVSPNRLLLETDGPYQAPLKGQEATPCFIPKLAEQIAAFRSEEPTEFAARVFNNSLEFIRPW